MIKNKINYVIKRLENKIYISNPETFHIIVTYRCNSRCTYCSIWKKSEKEKELALEEIKKIFSDSILSKVKNVSLTGGEPFLREDIIELIRFFVSKGKNVSINTNGLMTDLILEKLKGVQDIKDNIHIGISIDGKEKTHNKLRGIKNAYKKSIDTIEGLKKLGFKESISFTIGPKNFKDLLYVYDLSKRYNVGFAMRPVQICKYYNNIDRNFVFKKNDILEIKESIYKILHDQIILKRRKDFKRFFDINLVFWDNIVNYIEGKPLKTKCYALRKFLFLDPYGNILACPDIVTKYNIRNSCFSEKWKSKDFKKLQKDISKLKLCEYCWNDCAIGSNLMETPLKTAKNSFQTLRKLSK
jgi:MoaA/NifB/PqqE/SkfB family radical SAM enzyme